MYIRGAMAVLRAVIPIPFPLTSYTAKVLAEKLSIVPVVLCFNMYYRPTAPSIFWILSFRVVMPYYNDKQINQLIFGY